MVLSSKQREFHILVAWFLGFKCAILCTCLSTLFCLHLCLVIYGPTKDGLKNWDRHKAPNAALTSMGRVGHVVMFLPHVFCMQCEWGRKAPRIKATLVMEIQASCLKTNSMVPTSRATRWGENVWNTLHPARKKLEGGFCKHHPRCALCAIRLAPNTIKINKSHMHENMHPNKICWFIMFLLWTWILVIAYEYIL